MVVRGRRGVPQQVGAVAARALLRVGHAVPQLERALEVALGLAEREDALGAEPGRDRRAERARDVVGGVPVACELRRHRGRRNVAEQRGVALERVGQPGVQVAALARQQVAVDRLADQRVAERVGVARGGHQHLVRDRLAQALPQVRGVELGQPGEQGMAHRVLDRDDAHDLLRVGAEPLDAVEQQVAQRVRQVERALGGRGEQLLGVERVALAALIQAVRQLLGGGLVEDRARPGRRPPRG